MDNQQSLLYNIMLFDFAVQDSSLFLDTHPKDQNAFSYFKEASHRLQQTKDAYEKAFGPLSNRSAVGNHYSYSEGPWPWEGNC